MIRFVTTNEGKVREAREYLGDVEQFDYDYTEIQHDDLAEIAAHGAREAFDAVGGEEPVIVDDSGLFVEALGGFPGPYSAYVEDTVGIERVWNMMQAEENRRASFKGVVAYCDGEREEPSSSERASSAERSSADQSSGRSPREDGDKPRARVETFEGAVRGTIVAPRGDGGFGYDPLFEHDGQTMAEMTTEEKNALSHRGRALAKFADWLAEQE